MPDNFCFLIWWNVNFDPRGPPGPLGVRGQIWIAYSVLSDGKVKHYQFGLATASGFWDHSNIIRLGVTDAVAKFAQRSDNAHRRQRQQHSQTTVVLGDLGRKLTIKLIIKSMSYLCELAIKSFTSLPIYDLSKRLVILDLGHRKDALFRV